MVLAPSDVGVETIAVLGFDAKELVHGLRQVLESLLSRLEIIGPEKARI